MRDFFFCFRIFFFLRNKLTVKQTHTHTHTHTINYTLSQSSNTLFIIFVLEIYNFYFSIFQDIYVVFFFFWESFNLWYPLLVIALYHHIKTPISFWCSRRLNSRSLIQSSETLLVELTRTYNVVLLFINEFFRY